MFSKCFLQERRFHDNKMKNKKCTSLKTRRLLLQTFDKNKKSKIFEATDTNKRERGQK